MPSLLQLALGLEGLGLLRGWLTGDESSIAQRIGEVRDLAGSETPKLFPAPERDVHAGYGAWAATYDLPGNPFVEVEQEVVWKLLEGLPRGRILDAACGTGRHAGYLASRGHEVIAVDTTAEMLQCSRERGSAVRVCRGDLHALPLASRSCDAAVCTLALTHCLELAPPVSELARAVRPGGQIVIADIHPCAVLLGTQAMYRAADGSRGFIRNSMHLTGSYLNAFKAAGLEVLEVHEPAFRAEHAASLVSGVLHAYPRLKEMAEAAIEGLPAIIVWRLVRPSRTI